MNTETHQDIKSHSWILQKMPEEWRPFAVLARIDRPVGIWLLLLPALWGIVLGGFNLWVAVLFVVGAVVMRSAGCVVNDIWDRKLDAQIERTRMRPLASGELDVWQAVWFLSILLIVGLLILLQFNELTIVLGLLSVPLIAAYPLMKRLTWWPQAFLGLAFNFGALMGYSAVADVLDWRAFALYASGILWTLAYDTIYAHQDIEDDAVVGVKSTARLFGAASPRFVYGFYVGSWVLAALAVDPYGWVFVLPAAFYAVWILYSWRVDVAQSCLRAFQQSAVYGALILGGIVLATI